MKKILVAPLNWGLGHATRCIPIIDALVKHNFQPIIASDGIALELLKKEFHSIESIELPSYNITYSKKANSFKLKLIKDSPHLIKTIKKERNIIKSIVKEHNIDGIISDNRFGVRHKNIPSVFITHQLRVLSGSTTWLSTKMHQKIISKFDECWVPDNIGEPNLSGELGHYETPDNSIKYLGPLSRFNKKDVEVIYDIMVLLSGPEPQRSFLEDILLRTLKDYDGKILFVKGKVEKRQSKIVAENMTIYNFMTSNELETALNSSQFIISRSGYTTIMDLAKLEKKAFFIPTPGQFEQEYLAKKLDEEGVIPFCKQKHFNIEQLNRIEDYEGFTSTDYAINYKKLFNFFQRK